MLFFSMHSTERNFSAFFADSSADFIVSLISIAEKDFRFLRNSAFSFNSSVFLLLYLLLCLTFFECHHTYFMQLKWIHALENFVKSNIEAPTYWINMINHKVSGRKWISNKILYFNLPIYWKSPPICCLTMRKLK